MTVKAFLWQYRQCKRDIVIKERKIQILKEKAKSLEQSTSERVQSSGGSDRRVQIVEHYIDLENELTAKKTWIAAVTPAVCDAIAELTDSREREVMECLYLDELSLAEAAEVLKYSYRWVKILHGRALINVKEIPSDPPLPMI